MYNSETYSLITNNKNLINDLLSNPDKFLGNTKTHGTEYIPWFNKILLELGSDTVSSMLIQYFLYVVSNESVVLDDNQTPGIPSRMCFNSFGARVVNRYFYSKFKSYLENVDSLDNKSFTNFKDNNTEYKEVIEDDNFYARVGGYFIYALIECQLLKLHLDQKSDELYKYQEYVRLTTTSRNVMVVKENQTIFHLPSKLQFKWNT